MYFAVVVKEFITSGCGEGLPFQLGQLNPAETVSELSDEKGPEQTAVTKQL